MKKLIISSIIATTVAAQVAHGALEGLITISDAPGFGSGSGGAFTAKVISAPGINSAAVNQIAGFGAFSTFCLERNEYISLPGTYSVTISSGAIQGGVAGGNPDYISLATAWLYSQFRLGSLASAVFAATGQTWAQNDAGGNALQDAFWFLEQEIERSTIGTLAAALVDTAYKALYGSTGSSNDAAARSQNANGAYGVVVMNLYTVNGQGVITAFNQSQLAILPEPSTIVAGALLLLPFATGVVRSLRKKSQV